MVNSNRRVAHVLLVEDSAALRATFAQYLSDRGLTIFAASGVGEARTMLRSIRPDVTVLDLGLEDGDASQLIGEIVNSGSYCLIVSARSQLEERIKALELSADDFIAMPVDLEELYLRVRNMAAHPRTRPGRDRDSDFETVVDLSGVKVDLATKAILSEHGPTGIELTETEFLLLRTLSRNRNTIVSKETLSRQAFGRRYTPTSRSLDVMISKLRSKIAVARQNINIQSIRGVGYVLLTDGAAAFG